MINLRYPRTPHLPFSPKKDSDIAESVSIMDNDKLLLTEKLDGSCCALSHNAVYSRSGKPATKQMFDRLKNYHSKIAHLIPEKYLLYGEWCSTTHTIEYKDLPETPFFLFASRYIDRSGIGNEITGGFQGDVFEDFSCVEYWADKLKIQTVPKIGFMSQRVQPLERFVKDIMQTTSLLGEREGVVVKNDTMFTYSQFDKNVAKYVREDFNPGQNFT
jgi:hypothetical protein